MLHPCRCTTSHRCTFYGRKCYRTPYRCTLQYVCMDTLVSVHLHINYTNQSPALTFMLWGKIRKSVVHTYGQYRGFLAFGHLEQLGHIFKYRFQGSLCFSTQPVRPVSHLLKLVQEQCEQHALSNHLQSLKQALLMIYFKVAFSSSL